MPQKLAKLLSPLGTDLDPVLVAVIVGEVE